jgi:choline dehydrogenase-like flavoprotein
VPLAAADMEPRPWVTGSDWPIRRADIEEHYKRAQRWLDLPNRSYEGTEWATEEEPLLPLEGTGLCTMMYQFPDRNTLLKGHRAALEASENVTTYYNATVAEIESDEGGQRATGLRVVTAPGRELTFSADLIVLAQGLANPQLLLASTRRHDKGIGNQHDNVGRFFNDHPLLMGGIFTPYSRDLIDRMKLYDLRLIDGRGTLGHLELSDETLRTEECSNLSFIMYPRKHMSPRKEAGFDASQRIREALRERRIPAAADLMTALSGADGIAQQCYERLVVPTGNLAVGGWSKKAKPSEHFTHFEVLHQVEQLPHSDNRIRLSDERDAHGNRRIEIKWRWHDYDRDLCRKAQNIFARELKKAGVGEFVPSEPLQIKNASTTHFLGSTRMYDDPRKGVVDAQCRVHGMNNLYIAGGSVFTTGSFANPTLTIIALGIRLADHLKAISREPARIGEKTARETG